MKRPHPKTDDKWFTFAREGGYTFGVNPLGEVYRNDECLPCSTVNLADLRRRLGRAETAKDVQREFRRLESLHLTRDERLLVCRISALQEHCDADFRVYGGIMDGRKVVQLCCEFCLFDSDHDGWKSIRKWIADEGGEEREMDHRRHLDRYGTYVNGKLKWRTGRNHNRLETQIEVFWDVTNKTPAALKKLIQRLRASSAPVFQSYGVSVI